MAGDEASDQLQDRFRAGSEGGRRDDLTHQRVVVVWGVRRRGADQAPEFGEQQQVAHLLAEERLPRRGHPGRGKVAAEPGPGREAPSAERLLEHRGSAVDDEVIEPELPMSGRHPGFDLGRGEREQPGEILRCHVVPRRTQDVGPHDLTASDRAADGSLRSGVAAQPDHGASQRCVLGLHAQQLAHDVGRGRGCGARQPLPGKASGKDVVAVHRSTLPVRRGRHNI